MKRVGVFGGTFDPIHYGHLVAAEQARESVELEDVLIIPARIPPHKVDHNISSEQHRMNLLCLAVGRSTGLTASDLEIKREGISYTVDTVRDLARQFDVFLLMGHDSFAALETWHQYKDLFDHCRLIVMVRPGFQGIDWSRFSDPIRKMYPGEVICLNADQQIPSREIFKDTWKICILEIHGLEISASVIRDRVRQGRSIRFFTPDKVVDYIKRHKLYLNDGGVHDQSPYPSHQ